MFTINFQSRIPVYQQIYDDVVSLVSLGVLKPNTKLPPVRTLATQLGINPNTVSKAYKMLEADAIIYSTVGRGSFVSDKLSQTDAIRMEEMKKLEDAVIEAYKKGLTKDDMVKVVKKVCEKGKGNE